MRAAASILSLWLVATLAAGCTHSPRTATQPEATAPVEDEKNVLGEWRRGGSGLPNDMPQHLMPEKIHGGIM